MLVEWGERRRLERRVLMSVKLLELEMNWGLFNCSCILLFMKVLIFFLFSRKMGKKKIRILGV